MVTKIRTIRCKSCKKTFEVKRSKLLLCRICYQRSYKRKARVGFTGIYKSVGLKSITEIGKSKHREGKK